MDFYASGTNHKAAKLKFHAKVFPYGISACKSFSIWYISQYTLIKQSNNREILN